LKNPLHKIQIPKIPENIINPVEGKDVLLMIDTCNASEFLFSRDKAILLFLLDTGDRARELLKLNANDINLIEGSSVIQSGKGGKSRTIFLGKVSRRAINSYSVHSVDNNPALWIHDDLERITYLGLGKIKVKRAQ
jgi:integrase/recombinase XerD